MAPSNTTVIVVTYNSGHCIEGLAPALKSGVEVIFVDNASEDNSIETIRRVFPSARILANDQNRGFGAANNRALAAVTTPYALLLNPDCLPTEEFLTGLLGAAVAFPDAAIIAPHLIRRGGSPEVNYRWPATHWISKGPKAEGPCCVGFVCGAVMLLNMKLMKPLGFFDEIFFLYYEDEDLCQRVFLARKQIVLLPEVVITHLSRGSVKGPNPLKSEFIRGYHHAQSKLVFEVKYFGVDHAARLRWKTLILALLTLAPRLLLAQPRYLFRLAGRIVGLFWWNSSFKG
jgi:N-acetylglucosaminyl-diphospho-decaprenol L-rhamnosyltransferase